MSAYSTIQDLTDRHGPDAAVVLGDGEDAARVERASQDARALIDTYLEPRYELPLALVPEVLVRLSCDIVFYHLGSMMAAVPTADDDRRLRYRDALALLERIRSGEVSLGIEALGTGLGASFVSQPRRYTRDGRVL